MRNLRILEKIGIEHKEATLYLALLSLGASTAYKISKVSGIKRPTTYVLLEELRKKGLVLKTPHANKQIFVATPLSEYIDARRKEFDEAEHLSHTLELKKDKTSNVLFFEGLEGHEKARYYKLPEKGGINRSMYGHITDGELVMPQYLKWHNEMVNRNVRFRILVSHRDLMKYFVDLLSVAKEHDNYEIRASEALSFPKEISVEIEPPIVRMNSADTLETVVIENKRLAQLHSQVFDLAWENSERVSV